MATLNLVCLQYDIAWENKPENRKKVKEMLAQSNPAAGSLIVLPEMFETGFSMNVDLTAEDEEHSGAQFLSELAVEHESWVLAGLVDKSNNARTETVEISGANRLLVFDDNGKNICSYDKMHLFSPGQENQHFVAGSQPRCFDCAGFNVSPVICYDLRFPELFRSCVNSFGTELFIVIANWPSQRSMHWCTLLQARAIENQAYVVGVNRSGADPMHKYPGRTQVIDPRGTILADAADEEKVLICRVDLESLQNYRKEFPVLNDMQTKKLADSFL